MGAIELLLVRHGESVANAAAAAAEAAGAETIAVPTRDADVALSPTGIRQAEALGSFLGALPATEQPQLIWSSPYLRARQTAALAIETAGIQLPLQIDERLRDRELGVIDALTRLGVQQRLPLEAERRRWLGKFYYRPPGGEAWTDVALRLRSLLIDLDRDGADARVLLVCHDAVIMVLRYVCEGLTEEELLHIASITQIANASLTRLVRPAGTGRWQLSSFNRVEHLAQRGAPVTRPPEDSDALPA